MPFIGMDGSPESGYRSQKLACFLHLHNLDFRSMATFAGNTLPVPLLMAPNQHLRHHLSPLPSSVQIPSMTTLRDHSPSGSIHSPGAGANDFDDMYTDADYGSQDNVPSWGGAVPMVAVDSTSFDSASFSTRSPSPSETPGHCRRSRL